jgi:hypothetical protein
MCVCVWGRWQAMSMVLDVAVADGSRVLDPLLPVVLQTLHGLVCAGPDPSVSQSSTMKNANELLRCFEILGTTPAPSGPIALRRCCAIRTASDRLVQRALQWWPPSAGGPGLTLRAGWARCTSQDLFGSRDHLFAAAV